MPELNESAHDHAAPDGDALENLENWMAGERFQRHLRHLLPQHLNPLRFITIVQRITRETPKLLECHPMDICLAALQAATLGLEVAVGGECWIIPYGEKDRDGNKVLIPQLQVGYLGHLALAYRSEKIAAVQVDAVMPEDHFDYQRGTEGYLHHKPRPDREIGPDLTHVYAIVETVYGGKIWGVLSRHDLERIRAQSPSPNSPAWLNWYPEQGMAKVLKRTLKFAPKSREAARAITLDDEADAGKRQSFRTDLPALDFEATGLTPAQQAAKDLQPKPTARPPEAEPEPEPEPEPPRETVPARRPQAPAPAARRAAPSEPEPGKLGW